jgi:MoaA/NifB/PqqE/SkfB family radical SAM enzyme
MPDHQRPQNQRTIAVVMLHGRCNMVCDFCAAECGLEPFSLKEAVALLRRLRGRGYTGVVLGGGEPFSWPQLLDLAAEAKALGLGVQVGTNAVDLPPDFAALPAIDRYVLPLESARAETHDRVRHLRGQSHHALMVARLNALREAGREVTVSTVVTAENLLELPELGQWLENYARRGGRLHAWHLYRFIPVGRGGALTMQRFEVSEAAYLEAAEAERSCHPAMTIYRRPDMYHSREVEFFWKEDARICVGSEEWAAQER